MDQGSEILEPPLVPVEQEPQKETHLSYLVVPHVNVPLNVSVVVILVSQQRVLDLVPVGVVLDEAHVRDWDGSGLLGCTVPLWFRTCHSIVRRNWVL